MPKLTDDDARDLFDARLPLELEIVRRVVNQGRVPPQAAFHVYAMGQLTGKEPISEFVEADLGFHVALLESVNSPRLTHLYRAIQGEIHLTMVQSRMVLGPPRVHEEHGGILEALRAGDEDKAARLMTEHLTNARDRVAAELKDA